MHVIRLATLLLFGDCLPVVHAQELLTPLQCRPAAMQVSPASKQTPALRLPFFDDFSDYTGAPDAARWLQPSGAWVNRDYDALPPTLGMVTLDAIDARGQLYSHASTSLFAADTLQSLPIRLDSVWDNAPHAARPSDSICFSFYYLPGGGSGPEWERVGSRPGPQDSLILEFWNAAQSAWSRVWSTGGNSVDSLVAATGHRWQRVALMIEDEDFFSVDFAFRFRNLCSLDDNPLPGFAGNADQWLLDYIWLDACRSRHDSTMHDVAFVGAPPSMLKHFQSMPARQYTPDAMADSLQIVITNRYSSPIATRYQYSVYAPDGSRVAFYDGGYANVPPFLPDEVYQTAPAHARPPVPFTFPVGEGDQTFLIRHEVREGVGGDERGENDVMTFEQHFADYFAYDDGLPEKGYGVVSTGQSRIAVMFQMSVADTLTAVAFFFNRTLNDENTGITFRVAVWNDAGGVPGEMLYCDEALRVADAAQVGSFQRYALEWPLVVSGTVYVGLVQQMPGYINLGFDCGRDRRSRCFYSTGNVWRTTVYSGSLMVRPYFGRAAVTGLDVPTLRDPAVLTLFPNPVRETLHLNLTGINTEGSVAVVYDVMGRPVLTAAVGGGQAAAIPVTTLGKGCYLLVLRDSRGNTIASKRFIK